MNRGVVVLFLVTLFALFIWNCLPLGHEYIKSLYGKELEKKPILIISDSSNILDSLRTRLSSIEYIDRVEIERDSLITNKIIEIYRLEDARNIIDKYDLPDVMRIFVIGKLFDLSSLNSFEKLLKTEFSTLNYKYNSDQLTDLEIKKILLLKSYYIANGIVIFILLLMTVFLRIHFEVQKNVYWRIFRESGGFSSHRNKQYWLNSLILCTVPLLLIVGSYFILHFNGLLPYIIEPYLFGAEFMTLAVSVLLTRIFLGAKF